MSSSVLGFSPWRKRASSSVSQMDQSHNDRTDAASHAGSSTLEAGTLQHQQLSSSVGSQQGYKEPIRSFIHASMRDQLVPVDSAQNARSVREDTAELASYLLSDGSTQRRPSFLQRNRPSIQDVFGPEFGDADSIEGGMSIRPSSGTIPEVSEPPSPEDREDGENVVREEGPSALANLLKKSSPPSSLTEQTSIPQARLDNVDAGQSQSSHVNETQHQSQSGEPEVSEASEYTPLLGRQESGSGASSSVDLDIEGQKTQARRRWLRGLAEQRQKMEHHLGQIAKVASSPRSWNRRAIWETTVVEPVSCLPAVAVGLLLNILDALSYGMILFPLGTPLFSHLGSAGISIYYVSTIVAQLVFSTGSIFRGAVGSELIEVVPFFHNMAAKILDIVGEDNPDAVIATTIVAYALSSMLTGLVFYLMGRFKFGFMVGFIPRHILIGCIGGVGWFLIATGFEVSARLEGSLEYNLDTLQKLMDTKTIPLWVCPLVLAIILFYGQMKGASKYFLPLFILAIPLVFYLFVFSLDSLDPSTLRDHGWIFVGPPPDEPWWYFYTLYQLQLVNWGAIIQVVPAMFALTFFGILHVPINVPALALNSGEDHADLDKELKLHGYSNFVSGCIGSIQNYLVYANTVFFLRSGGNKRLAGYMLAILTFGVMVIGPSIIGWIPVMMVGTLIFDLGFELLLEAVWLPRKKLRPAEYATVIIIVLVMGMYDFVVGIGVGILLAFVSLVIQTSRVSAIRASYDGEVVTSTVRRNPSQDNYLQQVGRQIYIMKLTGYLFFGTVVSVEAKIRALLDDHAFAQKPIKFLILDMWHVSGLDYSAGEAFNTISRLLNNKGVSLILSGIDADSELGRSIRAVGLGSGNIEVMLLPDLNSALESCENELLKTLYARQEELNSTKHTTANLDVPTTSATLASFDAPFNSPRRNHLAEAAQDALNSVEIQRRSRWQSFNEPLRLMLQIFQGLSDKNEDFWFQATPYFERKEYPAGTVLFKRGEPADGFYLLERGIIRAEYDLPQGWFCESIVAGTTLGELPFFSEMSRTATAQVERDCTVWMMGQESWKRLQQKDPEIAREFLKISLKLTSERMSAITSYILTTAG
ncbi:sulfate transporter family domain-containing protein [Trichoderma sp. SZMC 28012]